ncbi:MAG: hypothetical protein KC912_24925 [Proteobacteria bacterium]|nr:hypothetical protein [Pseudomonadota bacterium]
MIWWLGAALAATPGGVRVGPGVPTHMVAARQVVVVQPRSGMTIAQTTLRAQLGTNPVGFDAELPIIAAWDGLWHDEGLGQWRLGARLWMGAQHAPVSLGIELAGPFPRALQTQVWGSLARDTLPGWEMMLVAEGSMLPDTPVTLRGGLGWRQGPSFGADLTPIPLAEFAAVGVFPLTDFFAVAFEAEVLVDLTPVTLRPFMRFDLPRGVSLDAGLQIAPIGLIEGPASFQAVAQVRKFL